MKEFSSLFAAKGNDVVIFRQTSLLDTTEQQYRAALAVQKRPIFGYKSSIEWDKHHASATETYDLFCNRALPYNIVDAPVDDLSVLPAGSGFFFCPFCL